MNSLFTQNLLNLAASYPSRLALGRAALNGVVALEMESAPFMEYFLKKKST